MPAGTIAMRLLPMCFGLSVLLLVSSHAAALADCPPNSSPKYESNNVVHCRCNPGYQARNGECVKVNSDAGAGLAVKQRIADLVADKMPPESAAKLAGMRVEDVLALVDFCKDRHLLIIFRASNPASVQYYDNPQIDAKSEKYKLDKTAPVGRPHAGLVVGLDGEPVRNDQGHLMHADYDMQGVYERSPDGSFTKVNTDRWTGELNANVFPKKRMVMHGDNDGYATINRDFAKVDMLRDPSSGEKFLIIEANGTTRIAEGASNLKTYYGKVMEIRWPYVTGEPHNLNPARDPDVQHGIEQQIQGGGKR